MSLDRRTDELKGKLARNAITASETITIRDRVNTVATAGGAVAVTLPPIADCAGMFFSFTIISGTNKLTFLDNNGDSFDDTNVETDNSIDAANDCTVLYSDGFTWHIVAQYVA